MSVVLIVEDEAQIAAMVADMLQDAGHTPHIVRSGELTYSEARRLKPDVILLDLMLPVRDGWAVARELHADPATSSIPIVVMTAMHRAADRAREIGTPHSVGKPFNEADLLSAVHRALTAAPPAIPAA